MNVIQVLLSHNVCVLNDSIRISIFIKLIYLILPLSDYNQLRFRLKHLGLTFFYTLTFYIRR